MVVRVRPQGIRIHERIRHDILAGTWLPGDKLQPSLLAEQYETSTTVVREALTRLVGEKLVIVEQNRGFFVQRLSLHELTDLTEVRCMAEGLALTLAIERGSIEWESDVTAAHHRLIRTTRRDESDPHHISDEWARAHRDFHAKLIEACGVPVLLDLARQLSDSTELYRRWSAPSPSATSRDAEQEHLDIMNATLARDAALATRLLREHYERTLHVVLEFGLEPEADSSPA
jgi:DNA-binding GntR family transcriptional regulator